MFLSVTFSGESNILYLKKYGLNCLVNQRSARKNLPFGPQGRKSHSLVKKDRIRGNGFCIQEEYRLISNDCIFKKNFRTEEVLWRT